MKKYQIIYADPPWDYKGQLQHTGKDGPDSGGAVRHYGCMKLPELKQLDIPGLCDEDCLLFMWATSPHLDHIGGIEDANLVTAVRGSCLSSDTLAGNEVARHRPAR